jgi:hypothetical protein
MGTSILPLVKPETTIQDALDQMKMVGCCGLVVQWPDGLLLLYVRALLEARDAGLSAVGQIEGGVPVLDAKSAGSGAAALDLMQPRRTWPAYESLFESFDGQYILTSIRPRTAMVVAAQLGLRHSPD